MHVNESAIPQLRVVVLLELESAQLVRECSSTVASTFILENISIDNGCPSLPLTHYLLLPRVL